ncbi:MAG: hypothetical protein INR67_07055, partial [Jatrophihabitans endophyticus]
MRTESDLAHSDPTGSESAALTAPGDADTETELPPAAFGSILGEALVNQSLITEDQRDAALAVQQRTGSPLGTILVSQGVITARVLFEVLASQWQTDFADDEV